MRRVLLDRLKRAGWALGLEVGHHRPAGRRRARFLRELAIETVLDVGANRGQYALELRRYGYGGRIVSFEPVSEAFAYLARAAAADPDWECHRAALGASAGSATIDVASNLASSSLLPMLRSHARAAPGVQIESRQVVEVRTLDSFELSVSPRTLLKLDVQGYEDRVLAGATTTLEKVIAIECELSVEPLYGSQRTLLEMLALLGEEGYGLVSLEPGFHDRTGRILQFEGWLTRGESRRALSSDP